MSEDTAHQLPSLTTRHIHSAALIPLMYAFCSSTNSKLRYKDPEYCFSPELKQKISAQPLDGCPGVLMTVAHKPEQEIPDQL